MEKLKVTLEDRPVDVELARYKRMFEAACSVLASIGDALGVEPEEGGAEPILSAIAELKTAHAHRSEQEPVAYRIHSAAIGRWNYVNNIDGEEERFKSAWQPLYAAPVKQVDLTNEDKLALWKKWNMTAAQIDAVIAADREKNK